MQGSAAHMWYMYEKKYPKEAILKIIHCQTSTQKPIKSILKSYFKLSKKGPKWLPHLKVEQCNA